MFIFRIKYKQDFLDNFFSRIRSRGCNRDNPTSMEFSSDYRAITVDSLFVKIKDSNCQLDPGQFVLKLNSYVDNLDSNVTSNLRPSINILLSDSDIPEINNIDANSLHLLCNNIINSIYTKLNVRNV